MKPNILFIHTDSMDGRAMGCMGHPALNGATPNIDQLAARGVLFENAYCNNPICCPSRASMLSGLFTHHCEGWNNHKGLSATDPTFLDQLVQSGYRAKMLGKTDYLSGQHTVRARVSPWTRSANVLKPNYRMGPPTVLDNEERRVQTADWHDVDTAVEWLHENKGETDPFFLYVGIRAPHPEFVTSRYYLNRIDESRVDLPPVDQSPHPVLTYQRINKHWMHGFSDDVVRLVRRIYFAMIAEVDAMVGELVEAVVAAGVADSTYIIFASDHGELAMEHRQFYKMSAYEAAVRVPLLIQGPGVHAGVRSGVLVSLVDIFPTLMDMAGLACPQGLDGYSLFPALSDRPTEHPGWILAEFHDSSCNTGFFMLRRDEWKYVAYPGYPPQLFNLKEDPAEIHDLAGSRPEIVMALDQQLREIVDYEAVDAKVKTYDRASFRRWRAERLAAGDYYELMGRIFSGWDDLAEGEGEPWTEADEHLIEQWLDA